MSKPGEPTIGRYEAKEAVCVEYDPRAAEVASRVAELITARCPELIVEHVGSTSVPGLAGKGVVDLMVLYPPGGLEAAKEVLDDLGFQRQDTRDPFPESRPMRLGAITVADGTVVRLHAHVIAMDADEAGELRRFREEMCSDALLRDAYVERKRAILAAGISDSVDYSYAKGDFIENVLRSRGIRRET